MEPLLVVLAELVAVAAIAGLIAVVGALLAIAGATLRLLPRTRGARLPRHLARLFIVTFSAIVVLLVLLQGPALPLVLRLALADLGERAGYELHFTSAHASVLSGALTLEGLRVSRPGELRVDIDRARVDLSWPSLLTPRVTVQELELTGLRGFFGAPARPRPSRGRPPRLLTIEHLRIDDAEIALPASATSSGHRLAIRHLDIVALRSDHAIEDLVTGARGRMRVDALELAVHSRNDGTRWEVDGIPLASLPRAPEALLRVADRLDLTLDATAQGTRLRLRCELRLRGLHANAGVLGRIVDASGLLTVAFEASLDVTPGAVGLRDLDLTTPLIDGFAREMSRARPSPRR